MASRLITPKDQAMTKMICVSQNGNITYSTCIVQTIRNFRGPPILLTHILLCILFYAGHKQDQS
jgi:hypothetical protein